MVSRACEILESNLAPQQLKNFRCIKPLQRILGSAEQNLHAPALLEQADTQFTELQIEGLKRPFPTRCMNELRRLSLYCVR